MYKILAFLLIALMVGACSAPDATSIPAPTSTSAAIETEVPAPEVTETAVQPTDTPLPAEFTLTSEQFAYGEPIPDVFTCNGADEIPSLTWQNAPQGTQSFALIMDDPDAPGGTWTHWVLYNIPMDTTRLPAQVGMGGNNSWGSEGYRGPCPPPGTHRYFFRLYALDTVLTFSTTPDAAELAKAMEGHILGVAEWMGIYGK